VTTPRRDGFRMPAEWSPHAATYMEWPTTTRAEFWADRFETAKRDYATVANAIAAFEPVIMLVRPEQQDEARKLCGDGVDLLTMEIDDSWMRDNGPIFVTNARGEVALVKFDFNAWGEKFAPWDLDATVPERLATHLGMRRYAAPMVLEGGSFFVDGEGTLVTTEQCLLNPNRNPSMTREDIEGVLRDYLGVDVVVWLMNGHPQDRDTDGHIDGILQYVGPGVVMLHLPGDPSDPGHLDMRENLRRLEVARDAAGRSFQVIPFEPGSSAAAVMNFYLCNGGAIVPTHDAEVDEPALAQVRAAFPEREVVSVPGETILYGGGGPHCITQQLPVGVPAA
jgi:agmatine deiminase